MRYFYLVLVALLTVGCSSKQELVKEALNSVGDRPDWVMVCLLYTSDAADE